MAICVGIAKIELNQHSEDLVDNQSSLGFANLF